MIAIPFRSDDVATVIFGPNWHKLSKFDQVNLDAVTESEVDFEQLIAKLEGQQVTADHRRFVACLRHFTNWLETTR